MSDQNSGGNDGEVNRVRARGGSTPGVVRYVLGISLVLIVVVFGIVLVYYG